MIEIKKRYRSKYNGENIVVERIHNLGVWHDTIELVPNMIVNKQISNRAVVIGNNPTRLGFNLHNLKTYSGLLGANTVQTYGCNALYRDFSPDFLVATGDEIVNELSESGFIKTNIVYTSSIRLLEYPNKFYIIPYDPCSDAGTTAAYIAAFDGHKKIYLLGFGDQDQPGINSNIYASTRGYDAYQSDVNSDKWIENRRQLFDAYDDVDFVWVTPYGRNHIPEPLKQCLNLRQIDFRKFVLECDL